MISPCPERSFLQNVVFEDSILPDWETDDIADKMFSHFTKVMSEQGRTQEALRTDRERIIDAMGLSDPRIRRLRGLLSTGQS